MDLLEAEQTMATLRAKIAPGIVVNYLPVRPEKNQWSPLPPPVQMDHCEYMDDNGLLPQAEGSTWEAEPLPICAENVVADLPYRQFPARPAAEACPAENNFPRPNRALHLRV